jgi:hypothetical protein
MAVTYAKEKPFRINALIFFHNSLGPNVGYLMQGSPNRAVRQRARSTASSSISA